MQIVAENYFFSCILYNKCINVLILYGIFKQSCDIIDLVFYIRLRADY